MIRPLFIKYQKYLTAFANTNFGRDFLGIKGKEKIVEITPDGWHQLKDIEKGEAVIQATFFSGSPFLFKFATVLTAIDIASEYLKGIKRELVVPHFLGFRPHTNLPLIVLFETTFNPDAHTEVTSVDGAVQRAVDPQNSWANIRDGAGTVAGPSSANDNSGIIVGGDTNGYWARISRGIYLFDTSSLRELSVIRSATFQIYLSTVFDQMTSSNRESALVNSSPASNTDLVASDYANVGTTQQAANLSVTTMTDDAYNTWTLNATGIASIARVGITKFGLRDENDRSNSEPSFTPVGGNTFEGVQANYADGTNKPQLVVTYTKASTLISVT